MAVAGPAGCVPCAALPAARALSKRRPPPPGQRLALLSACPIHKLPASIPSAPMPAALCSSRLQVAKLLKQMEQIRLGEAEPPPIALPEYYEEEDSDDDDLFGEEDGSSIGSVDLGFFGDSGSEAKSASSGARRAGGSSGGAGRGRRGGQPQQLRGQRQQGRQRAAAAAPALEDPDLFAPAGSEGFFDDEEGGGEGELSEAEVEEMLQHFKKQRAEESKRRAGK